MNQRARQFLQVRKAWIGQGLESVSGYFEVSPRLEFLIDRDVVSIG